jgi:phosphatidylinositol alpha-1,6-mannosyltransferase
MRVVVTAEIRLHRTPDGRVWTVTGLGLPFWQRYLSAYDQVRVVARVLDTPTVPDQATRVDGPSVQVWAVPYYVGPAQYLRQFAQVRRVLAGAASADDMVIVRAPSPIGAMLAAARRRQGRPYAVELVGDPAEVFARGVVEHPLRPLLLFWSVRVLRRLCRRASGVAYVTQRTLQTRYPAGPAARTAAYSSIELDSPSFRDRRSTVDLPPYRLVSVGSLEQRYKGVDVLIDAVARLRTDGLPVRLEHVGDGRHRAELARQVRRLDLDDLVTFAGSRPPGDAVRRRLDEADLFVMPSRAEGLPRALIEAMARGLPAVASTVGGIPELLDPEYLVPPDDAEALAGAIRTLLTDPARMAAAGRHNRRRAEDFASWRLAPRRELWYAAVRDHVTPRTRVAHIIGTLDRGGAETVALDVCRALPASEVHQTFVTLGGREGSLADEFRASGAAVIQCPLAPAPTFAFRLWRQLRALRPDVVVSHVSLVSGFVLLIALLAGVPRRVARMHSEGDGRGPRPLRRALLRAGIRLFATDVVGVTRAALTFAGRRSVSARYRVLHNGVNLNRLGMSGRATARGRLGLPIDATVLVHIGRCSPEKNRPFLLAVHRAAQALAPDLRLLVVGPGGIADLTAADPTVAGDDTVRLLGERRDIGTILAAADMLLLPSLREGLPGVVLEALACGVPVLATELATLREVAGVVEGLTLLPLAAGVFRWAEVAVELCGLAEPQRAVIRQAMRSSPFEFDTTLRGWEQLCRPRR